MKSHKNRAVFSTALLLAPFLFAAPANAAYTGHGMREQSISVPLADLNLATDAGVGTLYDRLQHAAETVCGPQDLRSAGSIMALRINKECYSEALDRAVARIGHEALDALHDA